MSLFDLFKNAAPIPVTDAQVLTLRPGDVLVLRTGIALKNEQRQALQALLKDAFGSSSRCIVLEAGLSLEVVRKELLEGDQ